MADLGNMQFHINVEKEESKFDKLCHLYDVLGTDLQSIIFVNTRTKLDSLTQKMQSKGHTVSAIHGDMAQTNRNYIMSQFRSGASRFLIICSDLLAGCGVIDPQQISLAINYDLPTQPEQYRRIEMFGRTGAALHFVTGDEKPLLQDIERVCKIEIRELNI